MFFLRSLPVFLALAAATSAASSSANQASAIPASSANQPRPSSASSAAPALSASASATPSCFQPRKASDPAATSISSVLSSAVPSACNVADTKVDDSGVQNVIYYEVDSYYFNRSTSKISSGGPVEPADYCSDQFNSIISGCVANAPAPGFWGGWILLEGTNWTLWNAGYPVNGLLPLPAPSSPQSSTHPTSSAAGGSAGPGSASARSASSAGGGGSGAGPGATSTKSVSTAAGAGGSSGAGSPGPSSATNRPASSGGTGGSSGAGSQGTNSATNRPASSESGAGGSSGAGQATSRAIATGSGVGGSSGAGSPGVGSATTRSAATAGGSVGAGSSGPNSAATRSGSTGGGAGGSTAANGSPGTGSATNRPGSTGGGGGSTGASGSGGGSATTNPASSGGGAGGSTGAGGSGGGSATAHPASTAAGGSSGVSGSEAATVRGSGGASGSAGSGTNTANPPGGSSASQGGGSGTTRPPAGGSSGSGSSQSAPPVVISPVGTGPNEVYSVAPGVVASGNPTGVVINGQTLVPGGKPYTSSGQDIVLGTGGLLGVDGTTVQLGDVPANTAALTGSQPRSTQASANSQSGSGSGSAGATRASGSPGGSSGGASPGSPSNSGGPSNPGGAGSTSVNLALITSTLTSAPPDFSTEVTTNTEWTGNTWLTTTQGGSTTIVPVLVGCPNCGGLHGGIILWNLPELPDVSFQFPKFPKLPDFHLPCIKIFGITVSGDCSSPPQDDNPSDDPNPSDNNPSDNNPSDNDPSKTNPSQSASSKSDSPTTSGPKSTSVTTTGSQTSRSTLSTSTQTTISTSSSISGCFASLLPGASGNAKRAVTSDAADACGYQCPDTLPPLPTTGPLAVTLPSADPGDYQKRALSGRFNRNVLAKRKPAVTITTINGCNLATPAGQPVTTPSYPGGYEFWQSEGAGNLPANWQPISRYFSTTKPGCIATVTKVPHAQINPQQNTNDNNNEVSVDHAYENGWLTSFMESITNNGGSSLTCNQLNGIFFTSNCNFMEPIFGALASATNPDFIVMSQLLNGDAKGWILGSNYQTPPDLQQQYVVQTSWTWAQAQQNIQFKLGTLNYMVLGCLMVQSPNLIDMIQKTNNRIYLNFQYIDQSLASDPTIPRYNFGFAQQYKDYMNNFANQWNGVPTYVQQLITNIGTDLKNARSTTGFNQADWGPLFQVYANYLAEYGGNQNAANWKYNIALAFDTTNTKRDLGIYKRAACALQSASRSDGSASETGSASGTQSSGGVTGSGTGSASGPKSTGPATASATITSTGGGAPRPTCLNNPVDEDPPNCIQTTSSVPFSCSAGSNIGLATYNPQTWCGCNTGTDLYPTMTTGTGNAACNYKSPPSTTVKPTIMSNICPDNPVDENPPGCTPPLTSSVPFSCSAGSNIGLATYNPATWCGCNTGTGIYPTLSTGSGNAACAYTTIPSTTVNPTQVSAS